MNSKYWRIYYGCMKNKINGNMFDEDWMIFVADDVKEFERCLDGLRDALTECNYKTLFDDNRTLVTESELPKFYSYYAQHIMKNPYYRES